MLDTIAKGNRVVIGIVIAVALLVIAYLLRRLMDDNAGMLREMVWILLAVSIAVIIVACFFRFVYLVHEDLDKGYIIVHSETKNFVAANRDIVRKIVFYGYLSMLLTIAIAVLPPIVFSQSDTLKKMSQTNAVGILVGCQEKHGDFPTSCSKNAHGEWVVNLGGRVTLEAVLASNPKPDASKRCMAQFDSLKTCVAKLKEDISKCNDQATENKAQCQNQVIQSLSSAEWSIPNTVNKIHGGVVVPLYVIMISLLGAAVGLTRRLPEFQRRGSPRFIDNYFTALKNGNAKDHQPPMDATEVRERLVFQVLQVLSAPLVAITAYEMISPEDGRAAVVIAFASGFSTEAVLLLIRKAVDALGSTPDKHTVPVVAKPSASASSQPTPASLAKRRERVRNSASAAANPPNQKG